MLRLPGMGSFREVFDDALHVQVRDGSAAFS